MTSLLYCDDDFNPGMYEHANQNYNSMIIEFVAKLTTITQEVFDYSGFDMLNHNNLSIMQVP